MKIQKIIGIILTITIILTIMGCNKMNDKKAEMLNTNSTKMNYAIAAKYINWWAKYVGDDMYNFQMKGPVKMRGDVGAAEFEFDPKNDFLIVRGMVDRYGSTLSKRKDILAELDKISKSNDSSLGGGTFEFDKTAKELTLPQMAEDEEPRLNLRINIKETNLTEKEFIDRVNTLVEASGEWHATKYRELINKKNEEMWAKEGNSTK
jgi:hypothetical protein